MTRMRPPIGPATLSRRTLIGTVAIGGTAIATLADAAPIDPLSPARSTTAQLMLAHPDGRTTRYRMMTPDRGSRWPVVLFSHGANSSNASYDRVWNRWVAQGFAVIGPDHIDTGPPASQAKPPAIGLWATRVADLSLPLRARAAFDQIAAAREGRIDWRAVAVAGHSFGAVVAQGLAGATLTDPADHAPSNAGVTAVRACIALSPPGPRPGFVPANAWATVQVPCLLQTGDADVLPGFVDDWHARLTGFAGAPDRWTYVGHGVDHYFGGLICRLSATAGAQQPALDAVADLSATFLTAYLKPNQGAVRALQMRARTGDDGIGIFASAASANVARTSSGLRLPLAIAVAAGGALGRRQLVTAALILPVLPVTAAMPAPPAPAPPAPAFPPSDTVPIPGASPPMSLPAGGHSPVRPRALADAQVYSDGLGGTALLVSVDGRLVHETYAPGFTATTRLKTYSMAKSVMGIAYGIAIAQGVVEIDDRLGDHVAEWRDDPRGAIRLRQLLQMRSGLKLESLARHDPKAIALVVGHDVTRIALETPLVGVPGAGFEYNNVNSFLAGLALDRALAKAGRGRYPAFLSQMLWRPLGQQDATLEVEFAPAGAPRFFAGLDASGRDWMRIGMLFTQAGRIAGHQIVPAAWLRAMTTASPNPAYGLQMWIGNPWVAERHYGPNTPAVVPCREPYAAPDLVLFDGSGGQRVYMVPSRRLVIVRTGAPSTAWDDSILPNTILRGMA